MSEGNRVHTHSREVRCCNIQLDTVCLLLNLVTSFTARMPLVAMSVLMVEIMSVFETSRTFGHSLFSVNLGATLFSGMLWGMSVNKLGCGRTLLVAALLSFVGYFASFFVDNVQILFLTLGFLPGVASGGVFVCINTASVKFGGQHQRSWLTAIVVSGAVGSLVTPVLCSAIIHNHGWKGVCLLLAAVSAQIIPISYATILAERTRTSLEGSTSTDSKKMFRFCTDLFSWRILLVILAGAFTLFVGGRPYAYLVDMLTGKGHTQNEAATVLTVQLIGDLIGNVVFLIVSAFATFSSYFPLAALIFISQVPCLLYTALHSYSASIVLAAAYGFVEGLVFPLVNINLREVWGLHSAGGKFAVGLGARMMMNGVLTLSGGPITGYIRDATNSYDWIIYSVAITALVPIVAILVGRYTTNIAQREEQTGNEAGQSLTLRNILQNDRLQQTRVKSQHDRNHLCLFACTGLWAEMAPSIILYV